MSNVHGLHDKKSNSDSDEEDHSNDKYVGGVSRHGGSGLAVMPNPDHGDNDDGSSSASSRPPINPIDQIMRAGAAGAAAGAAGGDDGAPATGKDFTFFLFVFA
jgi:hypothetical protein